VAWLLVAAVVLVLLAAWCANAEAALLRVSRTGARELGRSAGRQPTALQGVLAEVPRYLSVLRLVRVVADISATVLVAAVLVRWLGYGWRPFLITGAAMSVILYVVGGVAPASLGRQHAVRMASMAASVLAPVVRLLGPVPGLLLAVGRAVRPGSEHREATSGSEEDVRGLVDLLERRQLIEPGERAMIHSVFELGDTIAREVMVPRTDMVVVQRGKTLRQVLSLALRSGFSRIPVVGENLDDVVGIAYLKDIVTRSYEHREVENAETVGEVMRQATFVPESKPVDELLREMQARQIHLAIVIDEYGGTAGLITIEDILEEIVGEIADEYDRERPPVEWLGDGKARVTARLPVEELADLFGVSIEAEDIETVGGLLADRLGRVPIAGSVATVAGLKLTAESLAGRRNRIGTVTVERASRPDLGGDGAAERAGAQGEPEAAAAPDAGAGELEAGPAPEAGDGAPGDRTAADGGARAADNSSAYPGPGSAGEKQGGTARSGSTDSSGRAGRH
jgi:CBS domain containing-hemolysin-like protein